MSNTYIAWKSIVIRHRDACKAKSSAKSRAVRMAVTDGFGRPQPAKTLPAEAKSLRTGSQRESARKRASTHIFPIARLNPAQIPTGEPSFDELSAELSFAVKLKIVKAGAKGKRGRLSEAVPIYILSGLGIAVELDILVLIRFFQKALPFHTQGKNLFVHACSLSFIHSQP